MLAVPNCALLADTLMKQSLRGSPSMTKITKSYTTPPFTLAFAVVAAVCSMRTLMRVFPNSAVAGTDNVCRVVLFCASTSVWAAAGSNSPFLSQSVYQVMACADGSVFCVVDSVKVLSRFTRLVSFDPMAKCLSGEVSRE